jgi:hypothetical protein
MASSHRANSKNDSHLVFISYSHKDAWVRDMLSPHLQLLRDKFKVDFWDDTRIKPGSKWRREIQTSLDVAKVGILVLSADSLASPIIMGLEIPALLRAARERHLMLLLLIARPCSIKYERRLTKFQAVHPISESLIEMSVGERERVFVRLVESIRDSLPSPNMVRPRN